MVLFTITNRRLTDGDRRSFRIGKGQDLSESPDILTFFLSSIAARETHVIYLFARSEHVWNLLGYCDTPICFNTIWRLLERVLEQIPAISCNPMGILSSAR